MCRCPCDHHISMTLSFQGIHHAEICRLEDSHDDDGEVPVRDGQEKCNEIASNIKADVNE